MQKQRYPHYNSVLAKQTDFGDLWYHIYQRTARNPKDVRLPDVIALPDMHFNYLADVGECLAKPFFRPGYRNDPDEVVTVSLFGRLKSVKMEPRNWLCDVKTLLSARMIYELEMIDQHPGSPYPDAAKMVCKESLMKIETLAQGDLDGATKRQPTPKTDLLDAPLGVENVFILQSDRLYHQEPIPGSQAARLTLGDGQATDVWKVRVDAVKEGWTAIDIECISGVGCYAYIEAVPVLYNEDGKKKFRLLISQIEIFN